MPETPALDLEDHTKTPHDYLSTAVLILMAWTFIIVAVTAAVQIREYTEVAVICVASALIIGSIILHVKYKTSQAHLFSAVTTGFISGFLLSAVTLTALETAPKLIRNISLYQYSKSLEKFRYDPAGFVFIHDFAMKYYGVVVVLGHARDSWGDVVLTSTFKETPGLADIRPSYCELRINPDAFESGYKLPSALARQFVQGVEIHELSHCLDQDADLAWSKNSHAVDTDSIAPPERRDVRDVPAWYAAAQFPRTAHWREALADVMAVGFWRIHYPADAQQLVQQLIMIRSRHEHGGDVDEAHDTVCWVQVAKATTLPASEGQLLSWAKSIRNRAACAL